jgi:uncharacterized protein YegL
MQGAKIESVNASISETIRPMREVANENPNAKVLVRVIKFSDGAQWHVSQPTDIQDFNWKPIGADGVTDMGHALQEVAKALSEKNMPDRGLPPVLVLLTDGQPTDDFNSGLKALMDQPWGKKSVRIGIAIGDDADEDVIRKFIGNPEIPPLKAVNAADLARKIKWASTVPLKAASNPASRTKDQSSTGHVPIPAPPPDSVSAVSPEDAW